MKELIEKICKALEDKKASDITVIDIREKTIIADYFIICDASSSTLAKTICEHVEEEMEKQGIYAGRKEGFSQGKWIVLDYAHIIVHIFLKQERELYDLEDLWSK